MSELRIALNNYLRLRRSLGYKLERAGELLDDFVAYLERAQARTITLDLAVSWATLPENGESSWRAQRLGVVRCFARYVQAFDPDVQVPPAGLLPKRRGRPAPYLYSDTELSAIMAAARGYGSPLRAATLETPIGLMATTGLRVGEVIRLGRHDVDLDQGVVLVRNSKRG